MKKFIKNIFTVLLILPVIFLCSCGGRSNLAKLNVERYYDSSVSVNIYDSTSTKNIKLSSLLASSPSDSNFDSYTQFVLTGDGVWLYKMYIYKIYFYVYTNESTTEELIINFKITNVIEESEFQNENRESKEFKCERSLKPTKNGSVLCTIPVNMTIASAGTTSITIDILNSTNGTVVDELGNLSSFRWQIYGLEIYGESRAYSAK